MLVRRLRGAVGADDAAVHRHQRHAGRPGHPRRAAAAGRGAGHAASSARTIPPDNIIGETLRRATGRRHRSAQTGSRLELPRSPSDLGCAARPIPWPSGSSRHSGCATDDEGGWPGSPRPGCTTLPTALRAVTGVELLRPASRRCANCCWPARTRRDAEGRPLFAFKLHQFIGKGDTAYATLEPPETRYLTTQYQRSAPRASRVSRCSRWRSAANAARTSWSSTSTRGGEKFSPRILNGGRGEQAEATGLLFITDEPWPDPTDPALLDLVPDDWIVDQRQRAERSTRRAEPGCPSRYGSTSSAQSPTTACPLRSSNDCDFCPSCKTSYESTAAVGVLPGRQPGHRRPRQRRHGAVPGGRAHPAGASRPR